jgi:hypothetical protein
MMMKPPIYLTRLSELGSGVVLYGLEYPGLSGGLSWCYLTIAKGVIIATQPETDCGTSLTNIWCQEFFEVLNDLEPVQAAGEGTTLRWFEHFDREDPTLDEVILTEDGRVTRKFHAKDDDLAMAFEHLTGETIPDFASTGFEDQVTESLRQERSSRRF